MRANKYKNTKVFYDGKIFDSKKEAKRYYELRLLEKAREITDLQTQVKFVLIPSQRGADGKVVERECSYTADFVYQENGKTVVEDTKGYRTPEYRLKRKLMLHVHGIRIKEV